MRYINSLWVAAVSLIMPGQVMAQVGAGDVGAYVSNVVPANADALVTIPVNRPIETQLPVESVTGTTIAVIDTDDFAAGDFNAGATFPRFYVRVITGPAAGLFTNIVSNSETSITVADADIAALIEAGNEFRVYEHHTIASVFPDELVGTTFADGTQILFFSEADSINQGTGTGGTFSYVGAFAPIFGSGWASDAARPLEPETAFIVRNNSSDELIYIVFGDAPDHPVSYRVEATAGGRDTQLGSGYPVSVTVGSSGLGGVDGRSILRQRQGPSLRNLGAGTDGTFAFVSVFEALNGDGFFPNGGVNLLPNVGYVFRQPVGDPGGVFTVEAPYPTAN